MNTTDKFQNQYYKNMEILAEIKKNNPSATHIYMRRCDKDNLVIDIPIEHAEDTIRLRKYWVVVSSNKQMDDEVEKLFTKPMPPEKNTLPKVKRMPQGHYQLPEEDKKQISTQTDRVLKEAVPPKPSEKKKKKIK